MTVLVTGSTSGLGAALCKAFKAEPFVRGNTPSKCVDYDTIIHCAANNAKAVSISEMERYLDDNVTLTQRLLETPHRRFIYLSTVDLYPKGAVADPANDFDVANIKGLYTATKLMSEALVRQKGIRALILRPTSLLGPTMRPSSIYRMLTQKDCHLFLSANSRFNFILHDDVAEFIRVAIDLNVKGTYNLASINAITLGEIAAKLSLTPEFGSHDYDVGLIDAKRAALLCRSFARGSWETLNRFIDQLGDAYIGKGRLS